METEMQKVIFAAKTAASLILASGGETYRAEETADRIGRAFGYDMDIVAFPTALTMTVAKNGESAGSAGQAKRLEGIHILNKSNISSII